MKEKLEKARGPVAWMAGNSVAANLVMLMFLIGGFLSLTKIKQEVFPDIQIDSVIISVSYPGANPEDIEQGVIFSIEEAVRGLEGVNEITSVAEEGYGEVTVEMIRGGNIQNLFQDIQSEVNRITTFPEDIERPQIRIATHTHEVLSLILYGDVDDKVLHNLGEQVRDQLIQDPNITRVELTGLPSLEIAIEVSKENLRRYKLSLGDIANRIRNSSVDVPGGSLKTKSGEILVRMKERRDYGKQFAELPIIYTNNSNVLLKDIAKINDGFEESDRYIKYNGKHAVAVEVYRVGDQTPVQVSEAVHKQLEQIIPNLPDGVYASIHNDQSTVYLQRVNLLLTNGATGLILVMLLLGIFLEARLAFWVMMGIPVSFLGSFILLSVTGFSINMMTLFAYIITLGIVVDDGIVVSENVYYYYQKGLPIFKAAIKGTREVIVAVTFSVLTNMVTFVPLYFLPGVMGKIMGAVPIVVITVFTISLLECLFVLPSHIGHKKEHKNNFITNWLHEKQQKFSRAFMRWVETKYGPFLAFTIKNRYLTFLFAISLLVIVLSYGLSGRMGFSMFPKSESDFSQATVILPYGSPVQKTEAIIERLNKGVQKVITECGHKELVKEVFVSIGDQGSHYGVMQVFLADPDIRKKIMSTDEFTKRWRNVVGEIIGIEQLKFESDVGGPGRGSAITVELTHRDNQVLEKASAELAGILRSYPRVIDVDDGFQLGNKQFDFTVKPEGRALNLTAQEIANQVRNAFYAAEVLRQQRGRNEVKVMVRLPEDERISEYDLESMVIKTAAGTYVPLTDVANVSRSRAFTEINRHNGRRVVQVTADVVPRNKAEEILSDLRSSVLPQLMTKYSGLNYSFEGHQAEIRDSLESLYVTFVIALLAIYTMLAIPFRSFTQPFIVMLSIPFGIVGAFIGHLIMGYELSLNSILGIVALAGVVINDSLVLIDFANNRKSNNKVTYYDAIYSASIQRFRPILLTTLTTFFGLAPMIFETSEQARFLIPMAISLGFGLLFATLITLVLVPSLYIIVEDVHKLFKKPKIVGEVVQQKE